MDVSVCDGGLTLAFRTPGEGGDWETGMHVVQRYRMRKFVQFQESAEGRERRVHTLVNGGFNLHLEFDTSYAAVMVGVDGVCAFSGRAWSPAIDPSGANFRVVNPELNVTGYVATGGDRFGLHAPMVVRVRVLHPTEDARRRIRGMGHRVTKATDTSQWQCAWDEENAADVLLHLDDRNTHKGFGEVRGDDR